MDSRSRNNTPSGKPATVVEAPTLKEALRLVRSRHGEDARVIRSRTLTRRQPGGLGQEKVVEVLVQPSSTGRRHASSSAHLETPRRPLRNDGVAAEVAAEVERIESLVRQIAVDQAGLAGRQQVIKQNPVAEALVTAGADPGVVVRLTERCQAETGAVLSDRTALLNYLGRSLPTGRGGWKELGGTHVFLGNPGCGRSEMVLGAAAKLSHEGRQVLVLSLLPRHSGEVRRLQAEAAKHGFDAAVIQKSKQMAKAVEYLDRYDVVLMDAPAFNSPKLRLDDSLHRAITTNPAFHRHLVFPLDRDLRDSGTMLEQARAWNCDWLALSRVDQTNRRGKILDLIDQCPLPVSLMGDTEWPEGEPQVADPGNLTELILGSARSRAQARG